MSTAAVPFHSLYPLYFRKALTFLYLGGCALYSYHYIRKASVGFPRFARALPVMLLTILFPIFMFDRSKEVYDVLSFVCLESWLMVHKLIGLCMGAGPLCRFHSNFGMFTATLLLPVVVSLPNGNGNGTENGKQPSPQEKEVDSKCEQDPYATTKPPALQVPPSPATRQHDESMECVTRFLSRSAVKLVLLLSLIRVFLEVPYCAFSRMAFYGFMVYLASGSVCDLTAGIVSFLTGVPVYSAFDNPLSATSVSDFWRRWNRPVAGLLRDDVHVPLRRRLSKDLGMNGKKSLDSPAEKEKIEKKVKALTVLIVFVCSAVAHEMVAFYLTGVLTGEWLTFFMLQGVVVALEQAVLYKLPIKTPPAWVCRFMAFFFLTVTAELFLYPPLVRAKVDRQIIAHSMSVIGVKVPHDPTGASMESNVMSLPIKMNGHGQKG